MATFAPNVVPAGIIVTYPVASAGVVATAGAANVYGAYIQLAAAGLITEDFRLVSVTFRTPSGVQVGKIEIVWDEAGATTGPISLGEFDFEIASDAGAFQTISVPTGGIIPNGETLGARIKSVAGATTLALSAGIQPVG